MKNASVLLATILAIALFFVLRVGAASDGAVTNGLNWTVLFLMAMPYTIGGSIAVWIVYSYRRATKKRSGLRKRDSSLRLIETPKEGGR